MVASGVQFVIDGQTTAPGRVRRVQVEIQDRNTKQYLQDDLVGATSATWQYEVTLPHEGEWRMSATAIDNSGQSDLRGSTRDWLITSTGVAPSVAINAPAPMTPPTAAPTYTVTPGGRLTFSGTANDTGDLANVEISLRSNTTREQLAADGTWGTDVIQDWYRVSPANLNNTSYNWSYQTPLNLARASTRSASGPPTRSA